MNLPLEMKRRKKRICMLLISFLSVSSLVYIYVKRYVKNGYFLYRFLNGSSERPDLVERTRTSDVLFQSHSAVLGMQFYRGKQFPSYYQNGAFAAFHGS